MPAIFELRVREFVTDEESNVRFQSLELVKAWLIARPPFVEAVGINGSEMTRDESLALRALMRPLDAAERTVKAALDDARAALDAARQKHAEALALASAEKRRLTMRDADPGRPMEVQWTPAGLHLTDEMDTRAISPAAVEAIQAWVAERETWVTGRGQTVGEATLLVHPNDVPPGAERIIEGRFTPVSAG